MSDSFVKQALDKLYPDLRVDKAKAEEGINLALSKSRQIASEIEDQRTILEEVEIAESRLQGQIKNISLEVNKVILGEKFQDLLSKVSEQMKNSILETLGPLYTRGDGEVLVTAVIEDIVAKPLANLGKEQEDL